MSTSTAVLSARTPSIESVRDDHAMVGVLPVAERLFNRKFSKRSGLPSEGFACLTDGRQVRVERTLPVFTDGHAIVETEIGPVRVSNDALVGNSTDLMRNLGPAARRSELAALMDCDPCSLVGI